MKYLKFSVFFFLFPVFLLSLDRDYKTQAQKQIEIEREVSKKQILIHLNMAEEIESEGNLPVALEKYENFLILYENSEFTFDASYKVASIYQKMNDLPRAIEAFKKAYRIAYNQEKGLQAYLNAGRLYRETGDYKTAREIFYEISQKGAFTRISRLASLELTSLNFLEERSTANPPENQQNTKSDEEPAEPANEKGLDKKTDPTEKEEPDSSSEATSGMTSDLT